MIMLGATLQLNTGMIFCRYVDEETSNTVQNHSFGSQNLERPEIQCFFFYIHTYRHFATGGAAVEYGSSLHDRTTHRLFCNLWCL